MTTAPTFRTGTTFQHSGATCYVWRTTRTKVFYVAKRAGAEDAYREATRAALVGFVTAGLINA